MAGWIRDILVSTLKSGDFDRLYGLHGIRCLDTTLACATLAFVSLAVAVLRRARQQADAA